MFVIFSSLTHFHGATTTTAAAHRKIFCNFWFIFIPNMYMSVHVFFSMRTSKIRNRIFRKFFEQLHVPFQLINYARSSFSFCCCFSYKQSEQEQQVSCVWVVA